MRIKLPLYIRRFGIKSVVRGNSSPSKDFKADVLTVNPSLEQCWFWNSDHVAGGSSIYFLNILPFITKAWRISDYWLAKANNPTPLDRAGRAYHCPISPIPVISLLLSKHFTEYLVMARLLWPCFLVANKNNWMPGLPFDRERWKEREREGRVCAYN